MKEISLDRAVIGEANSPEFGVRAITHEGIRGLRAKKTIVGRIARKGLLVQRLDGTAARTPPLRRASSYAENEALLLSAFLEARSPRPLAQTGDRIFLVTLTAKSL